MSEKTVGQAMAENLLLTRTRERDELAEALRSCAQAVGAAVDPSCSAEFHKLVSLEVKLVVDRIKADNERLRGLLRILWDDADKYEQPDDNTRQWCPEMMCYLRGGVGIQTIISKEDRDRIDQELGQ